MSLGWMVLSISVVVFVVLGLKVWWFMRWLKKKSLEDEKR